MCYLVSKLYHKNFDGLELERHCQKKKIKKTSIAWRWFLSLIFVKYYNRERDAFFLISKVCEKKRFNGGKKSRPEKGTSRTPTNGTYLISAP